MENEDLIQALVEEGITPTETEIARLDAQISELAEILLDLLRFNLNQKSEKVLDLDSTASEDEVIYTPSFTDPDIS